MFYFNFNGGHFYQSRLIYKGSCTFRWIVLTDVEIPTWCSSFSELPCRNQTTVIKSNAVLYRRYCMHACNMLVASGGLKERRAAPALPPWVTDWRRHAQYSWYVATRDVSPCPCGQVLEKSLFYQYSFKGSKSVS